MPDDERPDARDPEVAAWLEVEPLDDVTRRRLVANALRERDADTMSTPAPASAHAPAHTSSRPSHAWRWIAAAAVVVIVLVGGLALLTAPGGHDEQQATRADGTALAPDAFARELADAPDVGDFGNLDDPANLAALRGALEAPPRASASASGPASEAAPAKEPAGLDASGAAADSSIEACSAGSVGAVVSRATGTIDGRPVVVVLLEQTNGRRSVEAVFQDGCEVRHLR